MSETVHLMSIYFKTKGDHKYLLGAFHIAPSLLAKLEQSGEEKVRKKIKINGKL